jgi:hypothetical protein
VLIRPAYVTSTQRVGDGVWAWIIAVAVGETTGRPLLREPMHLARDYIHPYNDAGGRPARCRVRIYLPDAMRDAPVVICSELPNNPGGSITNSAAGGRGQADACRSRRLRRVPRLACHGLPTHSLSHGPRAPTSRLACLHTLDTHRSCTINVQQGVKD